jgi:hypothetical protein
MSTQAEPIASNGAAESEPVYQPVDAALWELAVAEGLSIGQRVTALENVHRLLSEALDFPSGPGGAPRPSAPGA